MKRSIFALLCTLVVATIFIFAVVSCKSVIGGSSDIPPEEPGHYLKITGRGWDKIPSDQLLSASGCQLADAERVAILLPSGCRSVTYAYRMTREEVDFRFSGGPYSPFDPGQIHRSVMLSSLEAVHNRPDRLDRPYYGPYISGDTGKTNTSEGYVIVEFQLPSSSIWYRINPMRTSSSGWGDIILKQQ